MRFLINAYIIFAALFISIAMAAKPKTIDEWDACVAVTETSVSQSQVGTAGVEGIVKERCGVRPAINLTSTKGVVGTHPYDLVRSNPWKQKFQTLTKAKYQSLVDRLAVGSGTTTSGDWVVGKGIAPRSGGQDEAVIAINMKTGEVFAAVLEGGSQITGFGFENSWKAAPPYLHQWAEERSDGGQMAMNPPPTSKSAPRPQTAQPQSVPTPIGQVTINAGVTICADMYSMNKALALSRANNPYARLPDECVITQRPISTRILRESTPIPGVVIIQAGTTAAMVLRSDLTYR